GLTIDGNTINGLYEQFWSNGDVISNNVVTGQPGAIVPALIISNDGSRNQITGNTLDGQWEVGSADTDDGVTVTDEHDDVVSNNIFDGNRLVSTYSAPGTEYASFVPLFDQMNYNGNSSNPGERTPSASDFILGNNVFRNNDFGSEARRPFFGNGTPVSGYVID